ncbi:DCL family protein [Coleofasciculus sp. E1-EBD-02]|uniref:DCL family protein n=1 Tax=Coleofasciculus sp. E1-EBD-02 TaxID=3068481 RepID=UPI003303E888
MANPITIGDYDFPSKKSLMDNVRSILNKYCPGQCLDQQDFKLISLLLERHPEASKKIGCGINSIKVDIPQEWGNTRNAYKCFWVIRQDGTCIDFSYRECISRSTPKAKFYSACREAVKDQIIEFKQKKFSQLNTATAFDVDHVIPFVQIVEEFIQINKIDVTKVSYNSAKKAGRSEFEDTVLVKAWQIFHKQKAKLQILEHSQNLRKPRKAVNSPSEG